jgi:TolB protein
VAGENDAGRFCEATPISPGWIDQILRDAGAAYMKANNITNNLGVRYSTSGHVQGLPEGIAMEFDSSEPPQGAFCITLNGHATPGEYTVQVFIDVTVGTPYDFPNIPEQSRYLLVKVMPAVDFSRQNQNLLALRSNGIDLFNPDELTFTELEDSGGGSVWRPIWSPDGSRIVFLDDNSGNSFIVNADGSGEIGRLNGFAQSWSPDGTRLAFVVNEHLAPSILVAKPFIWVANADGSGAVELGPGSYALWSPVVSRIAYLLNGELWLMNADGSQPVKLFGNESMSATPWQPILQDFAWSPDGTKIAFVDYSGFLRVIALDGSPSLTLANIGTLITGTLIGFQPAWSPDGSRIALWCSGVCIADLKGGVEVVKDTADVLSFTWSQDGTHLYIPDNEAVIQYDLADSKSTALLINDFRVFEEAVSRPNP